MALRSCCALVLCASLTATPALAADLTSAQAAALEMQLRAWLASFVEPAFTLPARPVQLTATGDHLAVTLPIPGVEGQGPPAITAIAKPAESGMWLVSDIRVPSPASVSVPVRLKDGRTIIQETRWTTDEQHAQMLIDPALGIASTSRFDVRGLTVQSDSEIAHTSQHYKSYSGETLATPIGNGHIDLAETAQAEGLSIHSETKDFPAFDMTAAKIEGRAVLNGVDLAHANAVVVGTIKLIATASAAAEAKQNSTTAPGKLDPASREAVRSLLLALGDAAAGGKAEEMVEKLSVIANGQEVQLSRASIGMGIEVPNGALRLWLAVALDGLASPDLPPELAGFLPTRVAVRPVVAGINSADLRQMVLAATEPGADQQTMQPAIDKLFADGGVTVGLEDMRIVLPDAALTGTGAIHIIDPQSAAGTATVRMTGFDALMARVRAEPQMDQALPFLILARGLAKQDGDALAWEIAFDNNRHVTVNGTDMSKIAGGRAP